VKNAVLKVSLSAFNLVCGLGTSKDNLVFEFRTNDDGEVELGDLQGFSTLVVTYSGNSWSDNR